MWLWIVLICNHTAVWRLLYFTMCAKRTEALSRHRRCSKQNSATIFVVSTGCVVKLSFWPTLTLPFYEFFSVWLNIRAQWRNATIVQCTYLFLWSLMFKCKLEPNNIHNQAAKSKNWLFSQLIQMCLQYSERCRCFCNKLISMCASVCVYSAPVHLHVWTLFPQCSRVKYKREIWHFQESLLQAAALDLFPRTALFWKNHCIVIFYYSYDPLEVPQLPFLSGTLLPPFSSSSSLQCTAWPHSFTALITSKHSFPPHLSLSLLSSYTQHKPLTHSARCLPPLPWSTYFQLFFMLKKTVV